MIGKIIIGKSFGGCIKYCLNDKLKQGSDEPILKNRAEVLLFNQCFGNEKELTRQFNEVRRLNPKLSKPVLHITISLSPGELLTKDKLMEMCQDCAKEMGFENNQYVAIQHRDTNHQHVHIIANRIGYDKRTVSDSRNYQRVAAFCRKMELKFGLKQVQNPRQFLPKEQWQNPRLNERQEQLKKQIEQALKFGSSYQQFEQQMKAAGYQVIRGRGISFIDDKKVKIKGSEVGFSWKKIEKVLALREQVQNSRISKTNNRQRLVEEQSERSNNSNFSSGNTIHEKHYQTSIIHLQKQINDLIYQVMKPEDNYNTMASELLKNRKVKKRKRLHL